MTKRKEITLSVFSYFFFILMQISLHSNGQSRLIINGAKVVISNGAYLVLDNPDSNAIERIDGYIISEGANNNIKWNIGTSVSGTYLLPFGNNNAGYIPVRFTKTSGTGNRSIVAATYGTGWQNSTSLPAGISSFLTSGNDHSAYIVDRFWKLQPAGYTVKPSFGSLQFTYADQEHTATGNVITESRIGTYRWNEENATWLDFSPVESLNILQNTLTVSNVTSNDAYSWWILADKPGVLPIYSFSFSVRSHHQTAVLEWKVITDDPVEHYEIQRSQDGQFFQTIGKVYAPANTTEHFFTYTDHQPLNGKSFYRIRQQPVAGPVHYSEVKAHWLQPIVKLSVYPNPVIGRSIFIQFNQAIQAPLQLTLLNYQSQVCYQHAVNGNNGRMQLQLPSSLPAGVYYLFIEINGIKERIRLVLL